MPAFGGVHSQPKNCYDSWQVGSSIASEVLQNCNGVCIIEERSFGGHCLVQNEIYWAISAQEISTTNTHHIFRGDSQPDK